MTPSKTAVSTHWRAVAIGLAVALVGLILWDGARRTAADPTQPLVRGSASVPVGEPPVTLKLASFNIHGGKGTDGVRNLPRISELLADVDFAGLYEVRAIRESTLSNQAASLGRLQNASWVFAPTERQWWSDHFGNGLIYRIPVDTIVRIPLMNTRGKAFRNAVLSTVKLASGDVRIIAVHIDREDDRKHQLQSVIDLFLGLQPPCVLMGDLNTTADDPLLIGLHEHGDVHSSLKEARSDGRSSQMIDWIFTRGLKTMSTQVVENVASDHPCLKAELAIEQAP